MQENSESTTATSFSKDSTRIGNAKNSEKTPHSDQQTQNQVQYSGDVNLFRPKCQQTLIKNLIQGDANIRESELNLFIKLFKELNEKAIESMNKDEPETSLEYLKKVEEALTKLNEKHEGGETNAIYGLKKNSSSTD